MKVLCPTATRDEMLYQHLTDSTWVLANTGDWMWQVSAGQRIEFKSERGYVICTELKGPLYTLEDTYSLGGE